MQEECDKEKTAALIKEAQDITCQLRAETESLRRQMERVLEGGEDEPLELGGKLDAKVLQGRAVGKSFWQFWR